MLEQIKRATEVDADVIGDRLSAVENIRGQIIGVGIKLLPMNIKIESHKNVTYKSYSELRVAFARHGVAARSQYPTDDDRPGK